MSIPDSLSEMRETWILPPIMILVLMMFFPTMVFGSLVISLRRLKLINNGHQFDEEQRYLTISVDIIENVLCEARSNKANYVKFSIPQKDQVQSQMSERTEGGERNGT